MPRINCWQLFSATIVLVALAGCTSTPPATTPTQSAPAAAPTTAAKTTDSNTAPPAQPKSASPSPVAVAPTQAASLSAAAPAASPVARVEPKGKVVWGYHSNIAPAYWDPLEYQTPTTASVFLYAMHDAVIKSMPGNVNAPSLAESYEMAPDFKSFTAKLRANAKFHNGDPVTSEDVKFTYENYKGASASIFKQKTASIETPDPRTIKITFKEPFLDFLFLYGTPATAAGWVVPAKYYQQVGPDGFKKAPIGAGPYKFVSFSGDTLEQEAFVDYWRKTPSVKTFINRTIPDQATRAAAMQTGEIDWAGSMIGPLLETFKADPKFKIRAATCCPYFMVFPGMEKPDSPFNNVKVREAVDLALDRKSIQDAELGFDAELMGNWMPEFVPGVLALPARQQDIPRAKQLLAEAGYPDGFDAGQLTPYPPYNSHGERVLTQLRAIGVRLTLNTLDRGIFIQKWTQGPDAWPKGIVINNTGQTGDAATRIRTYAICPPKGLNSIICDKRIDELMEKHDASTDPKERQQLLDEIQRYIYDQRIYPEAAVTSSATIQGPRIANDLKEIIAAFPQYSNLAPHEDLRLKE